MENSNKKGDLTPEQLEKRKKLNSKIVKFFLLPVFLIIIISVVATWESAPPKTAEEARQYNIDMQFNPLNGEHRNLANLIKEGLNDPNSYEHVESAYEDHGDYLLVGTRFRGKNALGGMVVNDVKARVSVENGTVLEIIE